MWKIYSYPYLYLPVWFLSLDWCLCSGVKGLLFSVLFCKRKYCFVCQESIGAAVHRFFVEKQSWVHGAPFFFCQWTAARKQLNNDGFFFLFSFERERNSRPSSSGYPPFHTCIQVAFTGEQQLRGFCAALNTRAVVAWVPLSAPSPMSEPPSGAEAFWGVNFWPSAANFWAFSRAVWRLHLEHRCVELPFIFHICLTWFLNWFTFCSCKFSELNSPFQIAFTCCTWVPISSDIERE